MKYRIMLLPALASLVFAPLAFAHEGEDHAHEGTEGAEPEKKQISFEGIVLDPLGRPVPGAKVRIPSLGLEIVASAKGQVRLIVPPGTYAVHVSRDGFEAHQEEILLDESSAATGFELLLEYVVGEVVVTGTKVEQLAERAPVKTQVVSRDRIERRAAVNLADALEGTTGVRVENDCQNCNFTQLRLNGLEGHYTQMLMDGRPVFSTLAGVYGLEQIPQEMIERVEIVKGGGSALYGGSAVGGVVNVITRRPTRSFGSATFRYDSIGMSATGMNLGASAGLVNDAKDFSLHVFGNSMNREPWDANGDGFSEIGKVRGVNMGADTYWDPFQGGRLALKFHVLREYRRGGDAFDRPEHDAGVAEAAHTMRYGGEVHWTHALADGLKLEAGWGMAYTERDSYYGGGGDVTVPDLPENIGDWTQQDLDDFRNAHDTRQAALGAYGKTKNPLYTGDIFLHWAFQAAGEMVLTTGVQYWRDHLDDFFPGYDRAIKETYTDVAGILQHDWLFAEWGESVLGVRVDKHSELSAPVVSPRLALKLDPMQWLHLRTAVSTGFRAPQVFDEDLHVTIIGGEGQIVTNDAELKPEKSVSLAQQAELLFQPAERWSLKFGANGYFTSIRDAFVLEDTDTDPSDNTFEFTRRNRGTTTVVGGELEGSVEHGKVWGAALGLALERARNDEPDEDFGSKDIFRTPKWYGHAESWVEPVAGLRLQTLIELTGPMKVPHYAGYIAENRLEESEVFYDWSANVAYRVDIGSDRYLSPFVGMRNILDSYQKDHDRGADRDAGYVYGPRMPRTAFLGIKGGI